MPLVVWLYQGFVIGGGSFAVAYGKLSGHSVGAMNQGKGTMEETAADLMLTGSSSSGIDLLLLRLTFVAFCLWGYWLMWTDGKNPQ